MEQGKDGRRQRLKQRFLSGDQGAQSDASLLELLLYAIPQRDVKPLADSLLARFGTLDAVLAADVAELCEVDGVKESTATLIKAVDRLQPRSPERPLVQQTPVRPFLRAAIARTNRS